MKPWIERFERIGRGFADFGRGVGDFFSSVGDTFSCMFGCNDTPPAPPPPHPSMSAINSINNSPAYANLKNIGSFAYDTAGLDSPFLGEDLLVPYVKAVKGPLLLAGIVKGGVASATEGALVKTGLNLGKHTSERMAERGISEKMIQKALQKGKPFWDPKNKTVNYVLDGGFASGKSLLVGQNPITGKISTVIRGNSLISPRFIPIE